MAWCARTHELPAPRVSMTRFSATRLRQLDLAEIAWRGRGAADIARTRVAAALRRPVWDRRNLASVLSPHLLVPGLTEALSERRWMGAHQALVAHLDARPARFVIAPAMRGRVTGAIRTRFPGSARAATATADRMLAGQYDLLGYRNLPFDGRSWHHDAVHGKTAPLIFWSEVPYLDPSCGDHKIIWEINRHQHWMELGRAYWLTDDERYRDACLAQLDSWLAENPPLMGVNWASMLELAFRAISWIWALHFFADTSRTDRTPWTIDLLLGLDRQLTQIERHLSYYFSPNTHLLGEALALYISGRTLPELKASARREAAGKRVLLAELTRQVLSDGGHCERSAHYHRYTLDFYLFALAVARLTDDPVAAVFEDACVQLAEAARALADDTGRLPRIGDDDGGSLLPLTRRPTDDARDSLAIAAGLTGRSDLRIGDLPEEVWWVLGHERFTDRLACLERAPAPAAAPSFALPATGYYISRHAGDHLVVDAGPHGYMNAGHAHADALSLTFTRRDRPLLIDTGTGCYTVSPDTRDRFRSTALHNTLTLDARSQSIPRGPFHWRHVANGAARRWHTTRRFDYFSGTHDGYQPLVHARHILMMHGDVLVVADWVGHILKTSEVGAKASTERSKASQVAVHWHLHPAWAVTLDGHRALLRAGDELVECAFAGGAVEQFHGDEASGLGWHAPVYGYTEPTSTLRISSDTAAPFWVVSVFGLDPANKVEAVRLDPAPLTSSACQYATAIRVDRAHTTDRLIVVEPADGATPGAWRTDGIESDAAMMLTRRVGAALTALELVAATTVRVNRAPEFDRTFPARVGAVSVTADDTPRGTAPDRAASEQRKGTECAESPDSLMVRQ
jgi:uncharacterized heparinase superfamily protein